MKNVKVSFLWWLWTLGKSTINELLKSQFKSNIRLYYRENQKDDLDKLIRDVCTLEDRGEFVAYQSDNDLVALIEKDRSKIIIDLVGSYKFATIDLLTVDEIKKLVEDNFTFHSLLISSYFKVQESNKKLILITSSSVNKVNSSQPIYNALKTALSNFVKSVNEWFTNQNCRVIEFQTEAFKSNIYIKWGSDIPAEVYNEFKDSIFYAKKLVRLILKEV